MAKIFYQLRQNKNVKSKIYGKWFAHSKSVETMNTRKLSQHISEHGSIYTPDVVFGVLEKFRSCLVEMLLESKSVKIDGLGTFYTTIENEPGGAAKEEDFNVQKNLRALHIRFKPEGEQEMNISSREFFKKAEFVNVDSIMGGEKDSSGGGSSSGNQGGGGQIPPQGGDDPGEGD
jgi:predicted histone-like DNA-binding protein